MLGEKLKTARMAAGMSTRRVAELLPSYGVTLSHATISSYERGTSTPSMDVLVALSELYRRPLQWLMSGRPGLTGVRYRRQKSGLRVADLALFETTCQRHFEAYVALEERLQERSLSDSYPRFDPSLSAKEAAEQLRSQLGLSPRQPVPSVFRLIEELGIKAIDLEADERIDGLSARLGNYDVIAVNRNKPYARLRLDAAHELFHLLFGDCDQRPDPDTSADFEDRAFESASEFLMPHDVLCDALRGKSMVRLVQFKEMYGVSLASMVYRAAKVGLINQKENRRLWIEFSKRGWRQAEPGSVRPDFPWRFEYLIDMARNARGMRWRDIVEITALTEDELRGRLSIRYGGGEVGLLPRKEEEAVADFSLRLIR